MLVAMRKRRPDEARWIESKLQEYYDEEQTKTSGDLLVLKGIVDMDCSDTAFRNEYFQWKRRRGYVKK